MRLTQQSQDIDDVPDNDPYASQEQNDYIDDYPADDFGDDFMGGDSLSPMIKHNDLLKELTNFSPYLKTKVNSWLGKIWDEKSGQFIQTDDISPIMNEKGAKWCSDFLTNYARNNNIITNIKRDEYVNIMSDIIECVWLNVGTRAEEFNIISNGDILRVCVDVQHTAELVLMGAGDGKYNDLLSTVTNRHESVNLSQNPNNSANGMMPMMMGPGMMGNTMEQKKVGLFSKIKRLVGGK